MKFENIGANAGVVWRTLQSSDKELNMDELVKATKLEMDETAAAIGWLARENKIVIKNGQEGCTFTVFKEFYY